MASVHILIFGFGTPWPILESSLVRRIDRSVTNVNFSAMARFKIVPYIATHVEKSSKVCNIKVCIMTKYCILSSSANYIGTISKYIVIDHTAHLMYFDLNLSRP